WMERHHLPRAVGAAGMILLWLSSCGALAYSLQGQALTVIDELPTGARKLAASLRRTPGTAPAALEKVQQAAEDLQSEQKPVAPKGVLRVQVEEGFRPSSFVWSSSINLVSAVNQVVMVVFLTYFMLL